METLLQNILDQLPGFLENLLRIAITRQIVALVLVLLLTPLTKRVLKRLMERVRARLLKVPRLQSVEWIDVLFDIVENGLRPLSAWLLGKIAVVLFEQLGWDSALLVWTVPFFAIWLTYRWFVPLLFLRFTPERGETIARQIVRPILWVVALLHASRFLDDLLDFGIMLNKDLSFTLGALILGSAVFIFFLIVSGYIRTFLSESFLPQTGVDPALGKVLTTFIIYTIILVGFFMALSITGINLTALAFIAAGLSVGLGFGLQEVISNFVSGFILLIERSIAPGNVIKVGDIVGEVDDIGIRSTRIRTLDNIELIVPNSRFLTDVATNYTRGDTNVRVHVTVGVSYDAEPRLVEKALIEAARRSPALNKPVPSVQFKDFGVSSLDFDLFVWTDDAINIPKLSSDLRFHVWDVLAEHGVEIPYPQRDIHIRSITNGQALDKIA